MRKNAFILIFTIMILSLVTILTQQLIKMVYVGAIFRELAGIYNMSLSEFGEYAEDNPDIDHELDIRQVEIAKQGDVILEGRLSGWMMKKNKIY